MLDVCKICFVQHRDLRLVLTVFLFKNILLVLKPHVSSHCLVVTSTTQIHFLMCFFQIHHMQVLVYSNCAARIVSNTSAYIYKDPNDVNEITLVA